LSTSPRRLPRPFSALWRKTGIGEFFNHGASPRALPSVPMTTRGAPPVMLILVDLPPAPWIRPGSASPRRHPVAAPRVAPWPHRAPAPPLAPPPGRVRYREPPEGVFLRSGTRQKRRDGILLFLILVTAGSAEGRCLCPRQLVGGAMPRSRGVGAAFDRRLGYPNASRVRCPCRLIGPGRHRYRYHSEYALAARRPLRAAVAAQRRRAYIIADNKLAENAGWDAGLLKIELGELKIGGFDLA
jgi:hypothetical protein